MGRAAGELRMGDGLEQIEEEVVHVRLPALLQHLIFAADGGLAQRVLDKFKEHYEAYTALKREADIGVVAAMRKRSVFLTVGACQYLAGCKQKSWKYDASFQHVTREQTSTTP